MNTKMRPEKYRIDGIDCAQCANEFEQALKKLDGFDGASFNFASGILRLPAGGLDAARTLLEDFEPGANIAAEAGAGTAAESSELRVPGGQGDTPGGDLRGRFFHQIPAAWIHLARISLAAALTLMGAVYHDVLHATSLQWAEYLVFLPAYLLVGAPVLMSAARNIARGRVFDEMFLMSIATLGAIAIHELSEAAAVMIFYSLGEFAQNAAVGRSRKSIAGLMDLRPDTARVLRNGEMQLCSPEEVVPGEMFEVRPGERIPLDGVVHEGESEVNTAALTGESRPRLVSPGDELLAGFVNESGSLRLRCSRVFAESSAARVLELIEEAGARKAPTEKFISRFAGVYTRIIVSIAALIALLPPLLIPGALFSDWLYRALVILVISCPCALVLSIPLGYFAGIGAVARAGVLVKGAGYLDALKNLHTLVLDKTGTLTRGVFAIQRVVPAGGMDAGRLLALAAAAEAHSSHPVAAAIRRAADSLVPASRAPSGADESNADTGPAGIFATPAPDAATPAAGPAAGPAGPANYDISAAHIREERGMGVSATVGGRKVLVGRERFLQREGVVLPALAASVGASAGQPAAGGATLVHIAIDGRYAGRIEIADEIRPGAREALAACRRAGVQRLVMLTGDNPETAAAVAAELGLDEWHAGLLPEEKVALVEELSGQLARPVAGGEAGQPAGPVAGAVKGEAAGPLAAAAAREAAGQQARRRPGQPGGRHSRRSSGAGRIAFLGDGINDAPVIMRSDIGIAMGALGSDAAIEAADVVLMDDRLEAIPEALRLAGKTRSIIIQNIVFALGIKLALIGLGAFGLAGMWEAVIGDVGVSLLAVLNASRILKGQDQGR